MFHSLYSKIAAGLAGLFLVVGLVIIGVIAFSADMYQQEVNQKLNTRLAQQIVKDRLLMTDGRVNQEALQEIFHMLMVINPGIEIYLVDPQGKILTFSAPRGSVKLDRIDLGPVKKWLTGEFTAPLQGDDPKSLHRKKVFSAATIDRQGKLEGYLYVILGGEAYDSVVQKLKASYILQLSAWMIVAGLLFALVAGLMLFALLTGRLKRLAIVMDAFKRGDAQAPFSFPVSTPHGSFDEIDRLSTTFKEMAGRIETQMEELRASDKMRRELVANVSHDLRTPLATLQGYIETLLIKEHQYSPRERRQYLEIAIQHCQRLNKLVSELLELAKLESTRMQIHPEAFNIQELVQDVSLKFSLIATQKQIQLVTRCEQALPFVEADIALIERALENLIENALHYTPENGHVTIELSLETDIVICIRDTGSGIETSDLDHIFKRFYPGNTKNNGSHSGLGLAITSKIIELHKRQITVATDPGKGSCFCFSLPRVPHI
ncbi:MAG: HAMP domain-containing histidine kinase [Proteobacteria bacterium]|nr:HAMP domain-containing histidine kinase [Desulfobacula sp.]MBU3952256.1 HAMP domain-containing histidine kinase [Pseudomonadota bacterium]MBU4129647.1 HAMP domain-containing histidine kinase [Pseudomonadota bacterium]